MDTKVNGGKDTRVQRAWRVQMYTGCEGHKGIKPPNA